MPNLESKRFNNSICKECIANSMRKYGKFDIKCDGIEVEDKVKFAIKNGLPESEARWMYDPVYFFETVYGAKARWYQPRILKCTSKNLVGRQCRQTGKTLMFMYKIFHFVQTNKDRTVLVITPQEAQIKKIWDEYIFRDFIERNARIKESKAGSQQSPFYQITFDNGSKIILMIAGPGARSQTADWIYMDEAAIIPSGELNSIMGTILSKGSNATILLTSTPMGRGNQFYDACKINSEFNEYHVGIDDVEEIRSQRARYLRLFGETGFIQECLAEFPDTTGGPFNYRGIDFSKMDYEYDTCGYEPGWLYFGGVDWNGPNVGTYFYVTAFNPELGIFKIVDKAVIASATWNSIVAKQKLIDLNRKWKPMSWQCDSGYGHTIMEEIKHWSMHGLDSRTPGNHPDAMLKEILEPVEFGKWLVMADPFSGDDIKKTTKAVIVSQVSRLFEVLDNNSVRIALSKYDGELTKCLENYKLLTISDNGAERYGFDKKDGIEDHAIDAFMLSIYGVIKNFEVLFKKLFLQSVSIDARAILSPNRDTGNDIVVPHGSSIVLLTDNSPEPIYIDEKAFKEPQDNSTGYVSRTFNKSMSPSRSSINSMMKRRNSHIVSRLVDIA